MSTLTTTSVSVALGRYCVTDLEETILLTPAPMASYKPKVVASRDFDDDDFDYEYFSRTYKPLSTLPTPPPSHRSSLSGSPVLADDVDDDADADSSLLGMFGPVAAHSSCWLHMRPVRALTNQPHSHRPVRTPHQPTPPRRNHHTTGHHARANHFNSRGASRGDHRPRRLHPRLP